VPSHVVREPSNRRESLSVRSCFIDGKAIVVDRRGLSVFDLLRYRQHDRAAVLCAFDLIEFVGADLRRTPIEIRKRALAHVPRRTDGIALNAHYDGDGAIVFMYACKLSCEGRAELLRHNVVLRFERLDEVKFRVTEFRDRKHSA
jgi:ATP-dependent DNA ligase